MEMALKDVAFRVENAGTCLSRSHQPGRTKRNGADRAPQPLRLAKLASIATYGETIQPLSSARTIGALPSCPVFAVRKHAATAVHVPPDWPESTTW